MLKVPKDRAEFVLEAMDLIDTGTDPYLILQGVIGGAHYLVVDQTKGTTELDKGITPIGDIRIPLDYPEGIMVSILVRVRKAGYIPYESVSRFPVRTRNTIIIVMTPDPVYIDPASR